MRSMPRIATATVVALLAGFVATSTTGCFLVAAKGVQAAKQSPSQEEEEEEEEKR